MIDQRFDASRVIDFNQETDFYATVINNAVLATVGIIDHHSIPIDKDSLSGKISTLKIVRRDRQAHEHIPEDNTIFLSICNQEGVPYSQEEMTIFTIHELTHLISDNQIGRKYIGFDEFYTEYLTSLVASKIGGIALESFYRKNVNGYFGNGHDVSFIHSLIESKGFKNILDCYINSDVGKVEATIGKDVLDSMNDYFNYYDQLVESRQLPYRELNAMLQDPSLESERKTIEALRDKVRQSIV